MTAVRVEHAESTEGPEGEERERAHAGRSEVRTGRTAVARSSETNGSASGVFLLPPYLIASTPAMQVQLDLVCPSPAVPSRRYFRAAISIRTSE